MELLRCDPRDPGTVAIARAVEVIGSGGVVSLPTETFYGLAVDSANADAIERVNRIKGKPGEPVLLLAADLEQVAHVARDLPACFHPIASCFWPGPLTLVLQAAAGLPTVLAGGRGTVGVRVPGHAVPRAVALGLGRAITGPSANRHRAPPCTTAFEVLDAFGDAIDLVLDSGATVGGAPSTLLDLTSLPPRVLREGAVDRARLSRWLGA